MDEKKLLIQLFQQKDRKRKEVLYRIFLDIINLNASLGFIAELINKDLGVTNLITQDDIKYCRYYFKNTEGKKTPKSFLTISNKGLPLSNQIKSTDTITWTNPDEVNINQTTKSKFSKS